MCKSHVAAHILNMVFPAQLFFNVIQSCVLCDHSTVCCESQLDWKLWLFSNCSLHNLFHNCTTLWLIQLVNSRPLFILPVFCDLWFIWLFLCDHWSSLEIESDDTYLITCLLVVLLECLQHAVHSELLVSKQNFTKNQNSDQDWSFWVFLDGRGLPF